MAYTTPQPRDPAKSGRLSPREDAVPYLIGVSALAALIIGYLFFDWLQSRKAERKLERKKRRAREEWQQHLREVQDQRDGNLPKPDA